MRSLLIVLAIVSTLASTWGQDGLYADVVTSAGTIRVELYPEEAPLAVSNFVGLIEGSQQAIDPATGKVFEGSFYDGTVFHKVVKDFIIQAGSPTGIDEDGPGYNFQDEFHPSRTFDDPFVLAMANSGPNSNGSQFLITVASAPTLHNAHTVFGGVVAGSEVATSISEVDTDQVDRPLTPIMIETITIDRVGAAAAAFQPNLEGLPKVSQLEPKIRRNGDTFLLDLKFENRTDYRIYISRDLHQWTSERVAFVRDTNPVTPFDLTDIMANSDAGFFRLTQVKYPVVIFSPDALDGKTLDAAITLFAGLEQDTWIKYAFEGERFARATLNGGTMGDVTNYSYTLNSPTRATLVLPSSLASTFSLIQFVLNFASSSTGTFSADLPNAFPRGTVTMSGTFTLNETPEP